MDYDAYDYDSPPTPFDSVNSIPRQIGSSSGGHTKFQRRATNRDEFEGPIQFLPRPAFEPERDLPELPTNLSIEEQDLVLERVHTQLSLCAFGFVAKYAFPIPIEKNKRQVAKAEDREWTEWVYLLKRLTTKRRVPAKYLYNHDIKGLITILENSIEIRHASKHQSRPLKDDRNILQLISSGIQVAKILKDAQAMEFLNKLYVGTELKIQERVRESHYRL
jgi:hypothetical protein